VPRCYGLRICFQMAVYSRLLGHVPSLHSQGFGLCLVMRPLCAAGLWSSESRWVVPSFVARSLSECLKSANCSTTASRETLLWSDGLCVRPLFTLHCQFLGFLCIIVSAFCAQGAMLHAAQEQAQEIQGFQIWRRCLCGGCVFAQLVGTTDLALLFVRWEWEFLFGSCNYGRIRHCFFPPGLWPFSRQFRQTLL